MKLDQKVYVIVDAAAFDQPSFLSLNDPGNVGKENLAEPRLENWSAFFRAENDVDVKAGE